MDFGYSDFKLNTQILNFVNEILETIAFNQPPAANTWYGVILEFSMLGDTGPNPDSPQGTDETHRSRPYFPTLMKIVLQGTQLLALFSRIREFTQVLAYLRIFKESYDKYKKFKCQSPLFNSIFDIYSYDQNHENLLEEKGKKGGNFKSKSITIQNDKKTKPEKINVVSAVQKSKRMTIEEQIAALSSVRYNFVSILSKLYYTISSTILNCDSAVLADSSKVTKQIQSEIFSLLCSFYVQRETFRQNISRVNLYVGREEFNIWKDFDGDPRANGQQVVSVSRLKEKIVQILLDDVTAHNQMKNVASNDNNLRRILEFTNIINKILVKFIEKLRAPGEFKKMQDLLRILNFHGTLVEIFKIQYDEERHHMMLSKTIQFFEFFSRQNGENMSVLIPHCDAFIDLIDTPLQTSVIVSNIFRYIKSTVLKKKIIKIIFEKINKISTGDDLFLPEKESEGRAMAREDEGGLLRGRQGKAVSKQHEERNKLVEFFKLMRNLMVESEGINPAIQLAFLQNLIFNFQLSQVLLPNRLAHFMRPEFKGSSFERNPLNAGLLELLREFLALINIAITRNRSCLMIVVSILDQISLKTVLMNDVFHPLLKVQMVLFRFLFLFALAEPNNSVDPNIRRSVRVPLPVQPGLTRAGESRDQAQRSLRVFPRSAAQQVSSQLEVHPRVWRHANERVPQN
jgi:hypothetical protein